jgi:hypothetical protein
MPSAPPTDAPEASRLDLLALALLAGSVMTIVGVSVSAASAPKIGVVDAWGRIDDIASRVASWEYVLLIAVASGLLVWTRGSAEATGRMATATRVLLATNLSVIVVAAVAGIIAVFARTGSTLDGTGSGVDYYTGGEKIGETVVYVGIVVALVGVAVFARRLRAARSASGAA